MPRDSPFSSMQVESSGDDITTLRVDWNRTTTIVSVALNQLEEEISCSIVPIGRNTRLVLLAKTSNPNFR